MTVKVVRGEFLPIGMRAHHGPPLLALNNSLRHFESLPPHHLARCLANWPSWCQPHARAKCFIYLLVIRPAMGNGVLAA
jgi:hypothetical protein